MLFANDYLSKLEKIEFNSTLQADRDFFRYKPSNRSYLDNVSINQ